MIEITPFARDLGIVSRGVQAISASHLMSEAMHRLVQGMVDATFSGDHQIKGKAERRRLIGSTPFGKALGGSRQR